jgi:hypothetical protein
MTTEHTVKVRSFKDFLGKNWTWRCTCGAEADAAWLEADKDKAEADAAKHVREAR